MAKVLVIIDMQKGTALGNYHGRYLNRRWWRRHQRVVENIKILADKADEIIFVIITSFRRDGYLDPIDELKEIALASDYRVFKRFDNGSEEIAPHLSKDDDIWICGMNTDACVIRTARGLQRKGFDISIISDACWTVYSSRNSRSHNDAIGRMKNRYKMKILSTKTV